MNREIDKEIAEKIMNLPKSRNWGKFQGYDKSGDPIWFSEEGLKMPMTCPCYSTDFNRAMEVRDKVTGERFSSRNKFTNEIQKVVSERMGLIDPQKRYMIHKDWIILYVTAEDICNAALNCME